MLRPEFREGKISRVKPELEIYVKTLLTMAKKNRLESSAEVSGTLIGIATTNKDYRLVHFINQSLEIQLVSTEDIPFFNEKTGELQSHPFFMFQHPDLRTHFSLIANNNGTSFLIPSLRQISYFLLLQGSAYKEHIDQIIAGLRATPGIQAAIPVDQQTIREIGGILVDLEIHMVNLKRSQANAVPPLNFPGEKQGR